MNTKNMNRFTCVHTQKCQVNGNCTPQGFGVKIQDTSQENKNILIMIMQQI